MLLALSGGDLGRGQVRRNTVFTVLADKAMILSDVEMPLLNEEVMASPPPEYWFASCLARMSTANSAVTAAAAFCRPPFWPRPHSLPPAENADAFDRRAPPKREAPAADFPLRAQ
jgi:hypothetical protein